MRDRLHRNLKYLFVLHAFGFELLFGFTHPSDFRVGVNNKRYVVEVDMRFLTCNALGNGNASSLALCANIGPRTHRRLPIR